MYDIYISTYSQVIFILFQVPVEDSGSSFNKILQQTAKLGPGTHFPNDHSIGI